jgi:hypothetical protein
LFVRTGLGWNVSYFDQIPSEQRRKQIDTPSQSVHSILTERSLSKFP